MTLLHMAKAIVETARISVPTVAEGVLGRLAVETCDARLDSWSRRLLDQAGIELETRNLEQIPVGETFVVMSNHQSLYDIPAVFQALGRRLRMVAKTELFRVPIWGRAMRASGFVEVDRKNRERAIESLSRAKAALESGTNIWIAPEGTRSRTGRLGPFKKGGFHLALDTNARILPLTIIGSRDVLIAKTWTVRPGAKVVVQVHPPVGTEAYGQERLDELVEVVRRAIESDMPEELR
jgi:1-acyl-sn-glycerol-3-phosphate acyltransferase